jgi:hypothetical protein
LSCIEQLYPAHGAKLSFGVALPESNGHIRC